MIRDYNVTIKHGTISYVQIIDIIGAMLIQREGHSLAHFPDPLSPGIPTLHVYGKEEQKFERHPRRLLFGLRHDRRVE